MDKQLARLLVFLFLVGLPLFGQMSPIPGSDTPKCNYYVDSVNGNDTHAGTAPTTAWQTLTKASGHSLSAGQSMCFTGSFDGQLAVPAGGNSSKQSFMESMVAERRSKTLP